MENKEWEEYIIVSNEEINKNIYEIILEGEKINLEPGQFVNVRIPNKFLARPFSIADYEKNRLHIVYKVVGSGTEILGKEKKGNLLKVLTGLGNGFDLEVPAKKPVLIGGGTGAAPIYYLARKLLEKGINPEIILGFRREEESIYLEKFKALKKCLIAYETSTNHPLVTDYLKELEDYDYFYACGPKPMLKAITNLSAKEGELSLESRMACGIGTCKCCSIETEEGMKTLCKDGPVLKKKLVKW